MQQRSDVSAQSVAVRSRKQWIDGLRALAVIFVIFGHLIPGKMGYFVFTSPIKIPLFFMISGYLFKGRQTTYRKFFSGVLFSLVIPWICLTLPKAILKIPFQGIEALQNYLVDLPAGNIAWYMPCCIIAEILFFLLVKNTRNVAGMIAGVLVLFAAGVTAAQLNVFNYLMFNRALIVQVFLLQGYLFREYEEKIAAKLNWLHMALLFAVYIAAGIVSLQIWPDSCLNVYGNQYYNYPYCFAMIFLGCFAMFGLARKINTVPRALQFVGQNTLVYYLLHSINVGVYRAAVNMLNIRLPEFITGTYIYPVLVTIYACVMCGIEAALINRFVPWAVGKKRRPRIAKAD